MRHSLLIWLATFGIVHAAESDLLAIDNLISKFRCRHLYLDVGTNIGLQLNRLYRPEILPDNDDGFASAFDAAFGKAPGRNCRVCAIGFEPNPRHAAHLEVLQATHNAAGVGVLVIKAAATTVDSGSLTFFTQARRAGGSLHVMGGDEAATANPFASNNGHGKPEQALLERVVVPTVDLAQIFHRARDALVRQNDGRERSMIVAKIDIETTEYSVVPHLIMQQAMCVPNVVLMEWHSKMVSPVQLGRNPKGLSYPEQGKSLILSYVHMLEKWVMDSVSAASTASPPNKKARGCHTNIQSMLGNTMSRQNLKAFNTTKWPTATSLCASPA